MKVRHTLLGAAAASLLLLTAACGEEGSSGGAPAPETSAATGDAGQLAACEPMADEALVVLEDDLGLQTVDNVVPAVNATAAAASPGLVDVLDSVSATLDTSTLIQLNRAVDVERRTSSEVAAEFVAEQGLDEQEQVGGGTAVLVGAANFSESATLAEIYAAALDAAGFDASTQTIGNRETYEPALELGDLTVVPEYVGTLTEFLNKKVNGSEAPAVASSDLDDTVAALTPLGEELGLVFGQPAAAQDQNAFAVTVAFAEENGVSTLSELAETCGDIALGGPPECPERPFCQPGLEEVYGLEIGDFTSLDAGGPLTKAALQQGQIALGLVFSSDAALSAG